MSAIILLFSFIVCAQNIEKYDGKINIDTDKRKVQAIFEITFSSLSQIDTINFFLHKSAIISEVSSKIG